MSELKDFIRVYDDIVTDHECSKLIKKFESCSILWDDIDTAPAKFKQLNITQSPGWSEQGEFFANLIYSGVQHYFTDVAAPVVPATSGFEEILIRKYLEGTSDKYDLHIDVGGIGSSKRYLACLSFLNDSADFVEFPSIDHRVQCKKGRILMFPPTWMFPYSIESSEESSKYIMSTYLHYA